MTRLLALLGPWGRPTDPVAWAALAFAAYAAVRAARPPTRTYVSRARFLTLAGFAAAFLSLGYIAYYLRGGPRIIDATSYFLQGRAMSHGLLAWSVPDVTASFRGRFLLFHEPDRVAGIFPPGYPLLLALGFLLGAPMVIGPALAAGLALATYALARELAHDAPLREPIARASAILSIVCAALRYHTADTMSHGASALAITLALASALAAHRRSDVRFSALAGLAVGYVACTRTASALPIGAAVLALAWTHAHRARALGWTAIAIVPGIALLVAANRAATGDGAVSAQMAYYAASDGPPGCFRYGFGRGIGCLFEHKDFVTDRLANGYGILAALGTTLRRLRLHLTDVANFEPLALFVLIPAWRRTRATTIALLVVAGQVLAYMPFYFDGNYPGGGARFFADVLPIEHALVAIGLARISPTVAYAGRLFAFVALGALGFAVHASHEHMSLAERDGGRPMFEPDKLREANVTNGLVFVETDHGFNLAHDPGVQPSQGIVVARLRSDDHDRLLAARLGHPGAHLYRLTPDGPTVTRNNMPGALTDPSWKFESENDWPPLHQSGGWAEPTWASNTCASAGRVLTIKAAPGETGASVVIELPVPHAGTWRIRPSLLHRGPEAEGKITVYQSQDHPLATWSWKDAGTGCGSLPEQTAPLSPPYAHLTATTNVEISLDYVTIDAVEGTH